MSSSRIPNLISPMSELYTKNPEGPRGPVLSPRGGQHGRRGNSRGFGAGHGRGRGLPRITVASPRSPVPEQLWATPPAPIVKSTSTSNPRYRSTLCRSHLERVAKRRLRNIPVSGDEQSSPEIQSPVSVEHEAPVEQADLTLESGVSSASAAPSSVTLANPPEYRLEYSFIHTKPDEALESESALVQEEGEEETYEEHSLSRMSSISLSPCQTPEQSPTYQGTTDCRLLEGSRASVHKLFLQECKNLLKKKLAGNKHAKWIQKQWEKHRGNPSRTKEKLTPNQPQPNCLHSFISFKTGISTVDSKTRFLPAEIVQLWKKWKSSRALQLRSTAHQAEAQHSETNNSDLCSFKPHTLEKMEGPTDLTHITAKVSEPNKEQLDLAAGNSSELICLSNVVEGDDSGGGNSNILSTTQVSNITVEETDLTCEKSELSNIGTVVKVELADTSTTESTCKVTGNDDESESRSCWSEGLSENIQAVQALPGLDNLPRLENEPRKKANKDLTAEVSKYLLFREVIRGISTSDAAINTENTCEDASTTTDDYHEELAASTPQKTIQQEVLELKTLSPYRVLFEEQNKDLLRELLASLSEEAQLIKQAWNCSLKDSSSGSRQGEEGSTTGNILESKEKERLSLFLSLKDGKIQLKDKEKEQLQHDSLLDVVKKHGITTGFYMKITQEELMKKLPPHMRGLRSHSGRARSPT